LSLPRRLLPLLLLVLLAGACSRSDAPRDPRSRESAGKARIYLLASEGLTASPCDGRVVPVEVDLPPAASALSGSLAALLDAGRRHETAGFYNALAASPLKVERIQRQGGTALIDLSGYLEIGACDGSRALAQLTRTATQFGDVKQAEFFLEGQPLGELLAGKD
jgi:hypothetical protein